MHGIGLAESESASTRGRVVAGGMNRRDFFTVTGMMAAIGGGGLWLGRERARSIHKDALSQVNSSLRTVSLRDRDGGLSTLAAHQTGNVGLGIYILRGSCVWCYKNRSSINSLAVQLKGKYNFIGLALDEEWPSRSWYLFPVFRTLLDPPKELQANSTPTTLIVNRDFVITRRYEGAYTGKVRSALVSDLGVALAASLPS